MYYIKQPYKHYGCSLNNHADEKKTEENTGE